MRKVLPCLMLAAILAGCKGGPTPTTDAPVAHSNTYDSAERNYEPRGHRSRRNRRERDGGGQSGGQSGGQFGGQSGGQHGAQSGTQPGDFDFYLLNLSWSPEFCATHADNPQCGSHLGFVVHGLWPQNDDGTYPEHCSNAPGPANPQTHTDLMPTVALVQHEWQTHGTCSGQDAEAYFATVGRAFHEVVIPMSLQNVHTAAMLAPDEILSQFAKANPSFPTDSFTLSCGNNYLTAIEVCMGKDLHPESCQSVRSCHANVVKITPQ